MKKSNIRFYTVSVRVLVISPFSDPNPLRQKVPDPTGSGSTKLCERHRSKCHAFCTLCAMCDFVGQYLKYSVVGTGTIPFTSDVSHH
jgi:hypothetical protein